MVRFRNLPLLQSPENARAENDLMGTFIAGFVLQILPIAELLTQSGLNEATFYIHGFAPFQH
jgi:hypothetical protein